LTGWEIFSKLDAVKWNLNQAEDISPRVFRLLKGPSIPESNQRGKRNKNHMNPLIQLKKATPLFVIALVLACFALSPQALATPAPTPRFTPDHYCGTSSSINVTFSAGPPGTGGRIFVKRYNTTDIFQPVPNPTTRQVPFPSKIRLQAFTQKTGMDNSGFALSGFYQHSSVCLSGKVVFWGVIGGILLVAAVIWLFRKRSSASR
jgi:hypothetical protein